ncbi:hypothetical protein QN277_005101 [Acacia crassicarpa]|uniref:Uncharacterized protein n=1 Tax=Acacia crassicarpa TaxID=499986 RepID=A0AAE1IWC4_9FABA|nr:hypothetical protein QN277_005101 [Acacia crassicarpa]
MLQHSFSVQLYSLFNFYFIFTHLFSSTFFCFSNPGRRSNKKRKKKSVKRGISWKIGDTQAEIDGAEEGLRRFYPQHGEGGSGSCNGVGEKSHEVTKGASFD